VAALRIRIEKDGVRVEALNTSFLSNKCFFDWDLDMKDTVVLPDLVEPTFRSLSFYSSRNIKEPRPVASQPTRPLGPSLQR
jgi:hypothetical protein